MESDSGEDYSEVEDFKSSGAVDDNEELPLCQRLALREQSEPDNVAGSARLRKKKNLRNSKVTDGGGEDGRSLGKKHKNAPAEMKSNRPVRRLRVDADNSSQKYMDPRFSDIGGQLNNEKFLQSYDFLDKYQEDEIKKLSGKLKKVKSVSNRQEIKEALGKSKQEMAERRRSVQVKERLREVKREEREKIKNGKMPFFLKRSAKKDVALEQRYDELKAGGKLTSFMSKKRKRNANKDHRLMPSRR